MRKNCRTAWLGYLNCEFPINWCSYAIEIEVYDRDFILFFLSKFDSPFLLFIALADEEIGFV